MAIKSLEQRLSSILPQQSGPQPGEVPLETPPFEQVTEPDPQPIIADQPGSPSMSEGVEVAGLLGGIKGLGKIITEKPPKPDRDLLPKTPEGELPKPADVGGVKVIPEAGEDLTTEVERAVTRRQTFGITQGKPPEEAFNLSRFQTEDAAAVVGGVADALGIKTKRVSFDEIKAKAKESGISEQFLTRLMSPDGKMLPSAVDTYKALEVLETSAKELDRLFKLVADGQATDAQKLQLRQQIAFHGLVQKGVKGIQTETARALAVFRIPREGNADIVRQVLDEYGGDRSLQDMARSYLTIEKRADRNKLVEKSMFSSVKDVWFTTYINGLLSSPVSHARNILGNAAFGLYQIPERLVASLYSNYLPQKFREGQLPPGIRWWGDLVPGSSQEKIDLEEALVMVQSLPNAMIEGMTLARKGWATDTPSDLAQKVELQRAPQESMGETLQRLSGADPNTWMGKALDYYGTAVTVPGRALMAEDEFFKGTFYRMQMNALITRRGRQVYRQGLEAGMTDADAQAKAQLEMETLFDNPPKDFEDQALEFARNGTFTNELPPTLEKLQRVFNHPALKIIVPFFKTPANIGLNVIERTPFAPLSSRFRQEIAAGGVYRDMALAKVTLGSTLLATFGLLSGEGRVSGSGPSRPELRQALERTGWKPYSIRIGDNWYSYQGLEPMSAMLAIAADYAEYAINESDSGKVEQVFMGAVFGMYEYLKEQPYLQGMAEIANALGMGRGGQEIDGEKVMNNLTKMFGQFAIGGSPLPGTSSLVASIERALTPEGSAAGASPDLPTGVRGFVESFNRYRARLPYFNKDLPPTLNLWGDEVLQNNPDPVMRALSLVLPTRVSPEQFSEVDDALSRLGGPIGMPNKKINKVELSPQQYNRLLTIYGKETPAKQEILETIRMPGFELQSLKDQQQTVQNIHSKYMRFATQQLLMEDPMLAAKVAEVDALEDARGLYYKP